jgi:glutamate-1-semialdehyde 2,1-aminomutase
MSSLSIESSLKAFSSRFSESLRLTEEGKKLIPGGYSRNSFNFGPHAIYVASGSGAFIETADGHSLLDLNNNFTVNVLGHNHPAISDAMVKAIPSGISFGNPSLAEARLAKILIDRIPSVEKVQFSCSSTESCMSAIRVARAFSGKTKIAKFEGGYHGFADNLHISSHTQSEELGGIDSDPQPVPDSGGIPQFELDSTIILPQNDLDNSSRILREHADEIACLIMELQSGAGGLVELEVSFVEALRELATELDIVLIFDETISLRAGINGLQGVYGVTPDITVMGKIIGGGLPLGALGGKAEIMSVLDTGQVMISGTHHGHKLALVAGYACLNALTEASFDQLNSQAQRITGTLNEWSAQRKSPFLVFGKGFSHMAYGYMNEPGLRVQNHRDYWRHVNAEKTQIVSLELANRGFFPVHRGEFSLSVPMTDDDISAYIACLQEIVMELES